MPFSDGSMESDFRNKLTVVMGWLHIAAEQHDPSALDKAIAGVDLMSVLLNYWTDKIPIEFREGKERVETLADLGDDRPYGGPRSQDSD